jgi:hypothetical protein
VCVIADRTDMYGMLGFLVFSVAIVMLAACRGFLFFGSR